MFFFFKQQTAYEMRISDWSSDVCSSDLGLSAAEIWSNESQERYVLAILPDDLPRFDVIARRERCPYAVVGVATEERQLRVARGEGIPGVCEAAEGMAVESDRKSTRLNSSH